MQICCPTCRFLLGHGQQVERCCSRRPCLRYRQLDSMFPTCSGYFKIHQNASFFDIKFQIFLWGDTPEPPSSCQDPNLAPVNLFSIVNCYYIVNSTANRQGNYVFELSCNAKILENVLENVLKCPGKVLQFLNQTCVETLYVA